MLGIRKATMTYHKYYFYFTTTDESAFDLEVADLLDMELEDFRKLMSTYNGKFDRTRNQLMFDSKDDATKALDSITAIIVMEKL
jgi:hypothetical protein